MARKPPPPPPAPPPAPPARAPRRRRTSEEARTAILDAAEKRLIESGPNGIRLQEVAGDVGISHPTVLHHFGSREALVDAVVSRALGAMHDDLLEAVRRAPEGEGQVAALLDRVFDVLAARGHGRAIVWLALAGVSPPQGELGIRALAEVVHGLRRERRTGRKRMPPFEDTLFTVTLAAFAIVAQSVLGMNVLAAAGLADDPRAAARFRAWLARLMLEHFEKE